jgi:hypothetical protein
MSSNWSKCPGCREHRRLHDGFCQRCTVGIPAEQRVAIRRVITCERALERNLFKLEACVLRGMKWRENIAALYDLQLEPGHRDRAKARIEEIIVSIFTERPLLVGRIARQHAAILAIRRKHGLRRKPLGKML